MIVGVGAATCKMEYISSFVQVFSVLSDQKGAPVNYRLCVKAVLAMFLKENSIQDIIGQATDQQAAHILLTLLIVISLEKELK